MELRQTRSTDSTSTYIRSLESRQNRATVSDETSPAMPRLSKNPYLLVAMVAVSIGLLTIGGSVSADWLMNNHGVTNGWVIYGTTVHVYGSDLVSGVAAALASGLALARLQARRRALLRRMQAVEDVNHHVRNALTEVMLSAALHTDSELNARVRDASNRIEWVLRDVLRRTIRKGVEVGGV